jgi:hypothetical protein
VDVLAEVILAAPSSNIGRKWNEHIHNTIVQYTLTKTCKVLTVNKMSHHNVETSFIHVHALGDCRKCNGEEIVLVRLMPVHPG